MLTLGGRRSAAERSEDAMAVSIGWLGCVHLGQAPPKEDRAGAGQEPGIWFRGDHPLRNVSGCLDLGHRCRPSALLLAELGNDSLAVVELGIASGCARHGAEEPQGVAYVRRDLQQSPTAMAPCCFWTPGILRRWGGWSSAAKPRIFVSTAGRDI